MSLLSQEVLDALKRATQHTEEIVLEVKEKSYRESINKNDQLEDDGAYAD